MTDCSVLIRCRTRSVDSQMENLEAITTMDGSGLVCISTTRGVLGAVPLVAITSRSGIFYGIAVIDRQMQGSDAIATIRSSSGIYVIA